MTKFKNTFYVALLALAAPISANADIVTYDILWTGSLGNTMTGVFSFDDISGSDGTVRDRDGDLLSLEITSSYYGLSWTWNNDPTDPFNFNFIIASLSFPVTGAAGSTEAQSWNGTGVGLGLGLEGTGGRSGLLIDGRFVEGTSSLTASLRPTTVPEPGTMALLGIGLAALGVSRRRKAA